MDATLIGVAAGAIALGATGLRLAQTVIAKRNGDGSRRPESGKVDPAVWKADIRAIVQDENEELMKDIRLLLEARTGMLIREIKDPILNDVKDIRHDLRNAISEALARAYFKKGDK